MVSKAESEAYPASQAYDPGRILVGCHNPVHSKSTQTEFESEMPEYPVSCTTERRDIVPPLQNPANADVCMPDEELNASRMAHDPGRIANLSMSYNPVDVFMSYDPNRQVSVEVKTHPIQEPHRVKGKVEKVVDRFSGILSIPLVFVFGIILYLVDIGSDILASVDHFQEGHPVWGSLTITFVILPALCWAAVSWSWWYTHDPPNEKLRKRRSTRMLLAVLLLDPLTRY